MKLIKGSEVPQIEAVMQQRKQMEIQDRCAALNWAVACAARGEPERVTINRAKIFLAWAKDNAEPTK